MYDSAYWAAALVGLIGITIGGAVYLRNMKIGGKLGWIGYIVSCAILLTAGLIWRAPSAATAGFYVLTPALVMLSIEDVKAHRISNRALLILLGAGVIFAALDWQSMVNRLLAMAIYGAIFIIISLVSRGGLGMGDAKLLGVVGLYVGLMEMFTVLFAASVVACVAGIVVLIVSRDMKREVAFAPSVLVGILVSLIWTL